MKHPEANVEQTEIGIKPELNQSGPGVCLSAPKKESGEMSLFEYNAPVACCCAGREQRKLSIFFWSLLISRPPENLDKSKPRSNSQRATFVSSNPLDSSINLLCKGGEVCAVDAPSERNCRSK